MQDSPRTPEHAQGRSGRLTTRQRDIDRAQALRALTMGESVVYALRLKGGIIKIGCSGELADRRRMVEAGAEVLAFRFGTYADEQAIHASLVPHRARGWEYYHPAAEVLAVVNDMRDDFNLPHIAA